MSCQITELRDDEWVIPLRPPFHWTIGHGSSRGDYISGDAADKLAAYETLGEPEELALLKREATEAKANSAILESIIEGQHNPKDLGLITRLMCELAGYRALGSIDDLRSQLQKADDPTN